MSFKGIRNTNGRPKGSLNKLNSEIKETIANIIEGNAEGFKERLERLNDSDFIKYYLQLLKFVVPYQKPIDIPHIKNEFPFQKVDSDGMGMIKDLEIISVEKINDTTYKAVHTFTNPLIEKEMRIARNYFFTIDGETINNKEDITVEIKSAGEWVKSGF